MRRVAYGPAGDEVARYRKIHLSRVKVGEDSTSESDVFSAGETSETFSVGSFKVGLACCFDLRFFEHANSLRRNHGVDVITYAGASASFMRAQNKS